LRQKAYRKFTDKQELEMYKETRDNRWRIVYEEALSGNFDKEQIIQAIQMCNDIDARIMIYNEKNPRDAICLGQKNL